MDTMIRGIIPYIQTIRAWKKAERKEWKEIKKRIKDAIKEGQFQIYIPEPIYLNNLSKLYIQYGYHTGPNNLLEINWSYPEVWIDFKKHYIHFAPFKSLTWLAQGHKETKKIVDTSEKWFKMKKSCVKEELEE